MTPLGLHADQTNGLHMPFPSNHFTEKKVFLPQLFAPLSYNSAPHFSWRLSLTVFPALSKYANYKMTMWRPKVLYSSKKTPLFFSLYLWGQLAFVSERKLWYLMFFLKADCKSFVIRKPYEVHDFLLVLLFTQFPIRLITDKLCHMTQQINPYCCSRKFVLKILL